MKTAKDHEAKRLAAHQDLAQAALEWYEASEDLGYAWRDDRQQREADTHRTLREVIRQNWDLLH